MKTGLFVSMAFVIFAGAKSFGVETWDGCYQLYVPGAMYPAFCLDGTNEEGINGSGVRLVVFGTNTDRVIACAKSTTINLVDNSFQYIIGNQVELTLTPSVESKDESKPNAQSNGESKLGTAVLGKTTLKYARLQSDTAQRLLKKFYSEPRCQNVQDGEILNLKSNN